jgi:large subunit ribosomal protein L29
MKASDLQGVTKVELEHQLAGLRGELFNLRFQQATRQLRNPARMRHVKRDIARILTIMRQRESSPAGSETRAATGARGR